MASSEAYMKRPSDGKPCSGCGVLFTPITYRPGYGFYVRKSRETCGAAACVRLARRGKIKGNRKVSKGTSCRLCGVLFTPVRYNPDQQSFHIRRRQSCPMCCEAWSGAIPAISAALIGKPKTHRGPKHWNWRGGKADHVGRGRGWKALRPRVRKKQNYCCAKCGKYEDELGCTLQVHHKVPFHSFLTAKEANRLSNLEALCPRCHKLAEIEIDVYQMRLDLFGSRPGVARGSRHVFAKLTEDMVVYIRNLRASGTSQIEISKQFNLDHTTVSNICTGKTWRHAGGPLNSYRITEEAVLKIRELRAARVSLKDLAEQFGVACSTISCICTGKTWRNVGGPLTEGKTAEELPVAEQLPDLEPDAIHSDVA